MTPSGRSRRSRTANANLSALSSFEYERDLLGNPVSILREDGAVVYYEYDANSQLTKETQRDAQGQTLYACEWAYDPAGNRLWQVLSGEPTYYEYNAANELLAETTGAGTTYYDYDRCGNTVAKREPGGATTSYHWDYENLLRQVDLPGGAHNYFAYDADGKRVEKRDSAGYTRFTYQAGNMLALLQERDASGDLTAHYTMGNGLEAMQRDTGSGIEDGSVSFFHYDALGSTFELTDEQQAVTDTYRYNAWGEVLERTGDTDNPHTYVGRERYYWGQDLGLYMLGVRWYDQGVGKLLTIDPVGVPGGLYAYALSIPTLATDPSGLKPKPCRVIFWIGDNSIYGHSLWDWVVRTVWSPAELQLLREGYENSRKRLVRKKSYEVVLYEQGTVSHVVAEGSHDNIVGIITASHGGCSPGPTSPGPVLVGAIDVNRDSLMPASLTKLMRKSDPKRFQAALFAHCFSYWGSGKLRRGPVGACKDAYARGLGVGTRKVNTAALGKDGSTDSSGIVDAFNHFHRLFADKCCIP